MSALKVRELRIRELSHVRITLYMCKTFLCVHYHDVIMSYMSDVSASNKKVLASSFMLIRPYTYRHVFYKLNILCHAFSYLYQLSHVQYTCSKVARWTENPIYTRLCWPIVIMSVLFCDQVLRMRIWVTLDVFNHMTWDVDTDTAIMLNNSHPLCSIVYQCL